MLQRFGLTVCVAWMCLHSMPLQAWSQEKKFDPMLARPIQEDPDGFRTVYVTGKGIVQKARVMFTQTDQEIIYCYVGFSAVSFAGITYDTYLGSTALGAFSAFVDGE